MGGGDLNMKKHFHPLTMQNLERVWKAEQKAKDEAQKLEQLQKELEEERRREALQQHAIEQGIIKKKNQKLDWMYAGPQVNHEEYLLGRKIDKNVDVMKEDDEKQKDLGSSFVPEIADPVKDMAAKIKEDPLFLIRKKEDESKKELIQNPIKLRKLKEMLHLSVGEKRKHKKSKKNKKEKRRRERKEMIRKYESEDDSMIERDEERREHYDRKNERQIQKGSRSSREMKRKGKEGQRYNSDDDDDDLGADFEKEKRGSRNEKWHVESNGRSRSRREDDAERVKQRKRRERKERRRYSSDDDDLDADIEKGKRGSRNEKWHVESNGRSRSSRKDDAERVKHRKRGERSAYSNSDDSDREVEKSRCRKEMKSETDLDKMIRNRHRNEGNDEKIKFEGELGKKIRGKDYSRESSNERGNKKKISIEKASQRKRDASSESDNDDHRRSKTKPSDSSKNGFSRKRKTSDTTMQKSRNYGLIHPKGKEEMNGHDDLRKGGTRSKRDSSSDSSSEERSHSRSKKEKKRRNDSDSDSPCDKRTIKKVSAPPARMISNNVSRKLTAEELEKKRQEMMENAKWRDDQRGKNVRKYKLEDEKEEKEVRNRVSDSKAKFIHDLQVKSYSSSQTASVEDRIKRNIYTKQRTQDALSKKFTEK